MGIQMSLLEVSNQKGEDVQEHPKDLQKKNCCRILMRKKKSKSGFYAIWERNHLIGIIFSFLGKELGKIISFAPTKGWVEVIFRYYVAKYVATTLNQNFVVPKILWRNDVDLPTIKITASEYIIFEQSAFIAQPQ